MKACCPDMMPKMIVVHCSNCNQVVGDLVDLPTDPAQLGPGQLKQKHLFSQAGSQCKAAYDGYDGAGLLSLCRQRLRETQWPSHFTPRGHHWVSPASQSYLCCDIIASQDQDIIMF